MDSVFWRWPLATVGRCFLAALVWYSGQLNARAKGPDGADGPTPLYYSVGQCAQCHTTPPKIIKGPLVCRCTEAAIWNEHDKHRTAFEVLKGPRGQHMGE